MAKEKKGKTEEIAEETGRLIGKVLRKAGELQKALVKE